MGIFNEFNKKEKPVFTGIARGFGFGGGATVTSSAADAPNTITASGGIIADYVDGSTKYRAHIFTNSGALTISSAEPDATIEYLVVGAGGGGGYTQSAYSAGGGGGAGGLRTNVPGVQNAGGTSLTAAAYPVSAGTYTVVVGDGGLQGNTNDTNGSNGGDSAFYPPSHGSYPAVQYIRGAGGGGGGNASSPYPSVVPQNKGRDGNAGGASGGGTTFYWTGTNPLQGGQVGAADPNHPKPAGNVGGNGSPGASNGTTSGGGGGAGAAGGVGRPGGSIPGSEPADNMGRGGIGVQVAIAGPSTASPVGTPGPSGNGWFAGGGGAGLYSNPTSTNGPGSAPAAGGGCSGYQGPGSGNAPYDPFSEPAERSYGFQSTGGGGGGGGTGNPGKAKNGTPGQPGIVVVRYELPQNNAADEAKATGGAVSKVGSKIVHVFHHPGSLVVPATIPSVQYFLVGGGGAGSGADGGGGGGAGGVQTNIPSIIPGPATGGAMALPATTYPVTVGRGGACSGATPASGNSDFVNIAGNGEDTVFNSVTGGGGGRGGYGGPSPVVPTPHGSGNGGSNGSSGGGGGSYGSGGRSGGSGNGHGFDGGNANPQPSWTGAGGGGAGANSPGTHGGAGVQLPTTYHDPSIMTVGGPGPSSSWGWFGGGGGGGAGDPGSDPTGGVGGGGRGDDEDTPFNKAEIYGMRGTGGGGGGGDRHNIETTAGGMGGPGIVIIAYDA